MSGPRVPDAIYSKLAIDCNAALLQVINPVEIAKVGWDKYIADVFDLTDALAAELEKRLEARQWPPKEQP